MMTLSTALLPLQQQAPDPSDMKPGLVGLVVFLALCAAVVVLALSFRKQLKKINFKEGEDGDEPSPDNGGDAPEGRANHA